MEGELFRKVYRMVTEIAKGQSLKRAQYDDARIATTYLWAVLHDRPISWACQKQHWPIYYRRGALPTPSTMSRRLTTAGVQKLLKEVEQHLYDRLPPSRRHWIDAKPLPIGRASKDGQAGFGYAASGLAKGYKFHALVNDSRGFVAWTIKPMNHTEAKVAPQLIVQLNEGDTVAGDGAYDKNHLYDLAGQRGIQLIAPQRIKAAKGLGHRPHSPYRLASLAMQKQPQGQQLLDARDQIERVFGQLTNIGCGLSPLPNWVRTHFRVKQWVQAKLIFYYLWREINQCKVA